MNLDSIAFFISLDLGAHEKKTLCSIALHVHYIIRSNWPIERESLRSHVVNLMFSVKGELQFGTR